MATENQLKLFDLIAEFSVNTTLELVATAYKIFGRTVVAGDALPQLLLPVAEMYFNKCAHDIQSRESEYINEFFDKMRAIPLENENHPMDLLHIIVMLTLNCIYNMEIGAVISDVYQTSMEAVKAHLVAIAARHRAIAASLTGCARDHLHTALTPGEKIFSFTLDKYVQTEQGPVKLTTL